MEEPEVMKGPLGQDAAVDRPISPAARGIDFIITMTSILLLYEAGREMRCQEEVSRKAGVVVPCRSSLPDVPLHLLWSNPHVAIVTFWANGQHVDPRYRMVHPALPLAIQCYRAYGR